MRFDNKTFKNETINLDNNEFHGCHIENCVLRFSGNGPVTMGNNSIIDSPFEFAGPAATTLSFMAGMYSGGAKEIIEATFANIRKGETPALARH